MKLNTQLRCNILRSSGELEMLTLAEIFQQSEKTLLYVYPKDDTPGCTLENKDFSCLKDEFMKKWVQLIGISQDGIESHKTFQNLYSLNLDLISDESRELLDALWAFWEKNLYGKLIQWIIRSTYLFERDGTLLQSWKNVKATGHAEKVLRELSF